MNHFFLVIALIASIGCTNATKKGQKMASVEIPLGLKQLFLEESASAELIEKTERELGLEFPQQLREFYRLHNGYENIMLKYPYWETEKDYLDSQEPGTDGLLVIAHCYDSDPRYDFLPTFAIQHRKKRDCKEIPEWLLPFGVATDQRQLCISLRDNDYGKVFFFSMSLHDEMNDEEREDDPLAPLFFVASSLQDFFNNLRE